MWAGFQKGWLLSIFLSLFRAKDSENLVIGMENRQKDGLGKNEFKLLIFRLTNFSFRLFQNMSFLKLMKLILFLPFNCMHLNWKLAVWCLFYIMPGNLKIIMVRKLLNYHSLFILPMNFPLLLMIPAIIFDKNRSAEYRRPYSAYQIGKNGPYQTKENG